MSGFEVFIGRLHPLLLHFPIALILVAAGLETLRFVVGKRETPSPTASTCLWIGLVMCVLAVWAGWELAEQEQETGTLVGLHRWTAIATLALTALAAGALALRRLKGRDWAGPHVGLLMLAGVLVAISGHFGAEMVWGEGWLFGGRATVTPVEAPQTQVGVNPDHQNPETPRQSHVVGWDRVAPIFEAHCAKCHGPKRQKAGLQLVPWDAIFAGDATEQVVVPGDAAASVLHRLVTLPATDEDAMPPEGKADPLTAGQIETLVLWINAGALGPNGAAPPVAAEGG